MPGTQTVKAPVFFTQACVLLLFLGLTARTGASAELLRVRIGATSERTRLVLELSGAPGALHSSAQGDSALLLHLTGVRPAADFAFPPGPKGLYEGGRIQAARRKSTDLWIRFRGRVRSKVLRVHREKDLPERIVVDLLPRGVAAPQDPALASPSRKVSSPKKPAAPWPASRRVSPPKKPVSPSTPAVARVPGPEAPGDVAVGAGDPYAGSAPGRARPSGSLPGGIGTAGPAGVGTSGTPKPPLAAGATTPAAPLPRRQGPRIVVVDPGHGGTDPGAIRNGLREKDVTLDVGRLLVERLNREPGIKAILTRDRDVLIPLRDRMRLAERKNADLFVSIHVNAAPSGAAKGAEVFFLSLGAASDQASRELARLENEADPEYVVEEDEALATLPFGLDLRQSDTLLRSSHAAEVILDTLTGKDLAEARGVKQAGFAVLRSFQVPSVLVELGFISSVADRRNLMDPDHRDRLAGALADGVNRYFETYAPKRADVSPSR